MRGKFTPRGSRIRIFTGYSSLRSMSLRSQSLTIATGENASPVTSFFLLPPISLTPNRSDYLFSVCQNE